MEEKKYPIVGFAPGNYHCKCCTCERSFFGDKRAVQCQPCAAAAKEKFDALPPEEQAEVMKRNLEAVREAFKDWGSHQPGLPPLPEPILTDEDIKDWEGNERQQRVGWVKATARVPTDENLYHLNYGTVKTNMKTTGFYDGEKWHRQDGAVLDWHPNLEWLDEGAPAATREEDACDFVEWMRLNCISSQNGWVDTLGKWDTTKGWYELFKTKQKQ